MQALWMVLAAFLFASMSVCVKFASVYFSSAELVFSRGLIGMALLAWLARRQGVGLATQVPLMHAWRAFIGVISLGGWFYAIAHLPLATAVTLNYMSSLWIAVFLVGGTLMAWRPSPTAPRPELHGRLLLTVAVGFIGVVLLLRPSIGQGPEQALAGLVGLLAGMCAALAYMQVVALSRMGEPEARTVFYFGLGSVVAGGAAMMLTGLSAWPGWPALWLLPIGMLAAGGQLCMTLAYASAHNPRATLVVANLQYSGIVFGAFYGLLLFGDVIPPLGWVGMGLILASGILASVLRARTAAAPPAEEL
ncbi:MAG: DMT family transporter [Giesbergeria sp.]